MRYCGREFSEEELAWIKQLIVEKPELTRKDLSVLFCREVNWLKPDGGVKDMSCRVAMLKMERDGHLVLPPPRAKHTKPYKKIRTLWAVEQAEISKNAGEFDLEFEVVTSRSSGLWNEFIDRYHYLGYKTLPGAQLRYFIKAEGRIMALLGFGAAAWKTAPRDTYIGWDKPTRRKNLHGSSRWQANGSAMTGRSDIDTVLFSWRPSSRSSVSVGPAIRPPTGPVSARPAARANWGTGKAMCQPRVSGSTLSAKTSAVSWEQDDDNRED